MLPAFRLRSVIMTIFEEEEKEWEKKNYSYYNLPFRGALTITLKPEKEVLAVFRMPMIYCLIYILRSIVYGLSSHEA